MEEMSYFKSEKAFYEFCLLCLGGETRMEMLKLYRSHYINKELGASWYNNILNKIEDERVIEELKEIYKGMTK